MFQTFQGGFVNLTATLRLTSVNEHLAVQTQHMLLNVSVSQAFDTPFLSL